MRMDMIQLIISVFWRYTQFNYCIYLAYLPLNKKKSAHTHTHTHTRKK